MKYNCTQILRAVIALISVVSLSSCEAEFKAESPQNVEVGFCVGEDLTRTTMLSNGLSAEWVAGDKIAVWAVNSSGNYQLSNQPFEL